MFKIHEVRELIRLVDESSIDKFFYEKDGEKIKIEKSVYREQNNVVTERTLDNVIVSTVTTAQMEEKKEVTENSKSETKVTIENDSSSLVTITSPMVGTFYSKPSPEDSDYVFAGDKVQEKTVVCIVEAMKLFNEIEADVKGEVVEVLVKDGQLVEYGQPLFLVREE